MTSDAYVTTGKCADGTFYGAAWKRDNSLVGISPPLKSRSSARRWAENLADAETARIVLGKIGAGEITLIHNPEGV